MKTTSLTGLAREQLERPAGPAAAAPAVTVHGGHEHDLRQTSSHWPRAGPGRARRARRGDPQVLVGTVRLTAGDEHWDGAAGDHVVIPQLRHDLHAETDAVVLLTVATRA